MPESKDARIETALRKTVESYFEVDKLDELTVKNVRHVVERDLSLSEGFLKSGKWKERSKEVISQTADALQEKRGEEERDDREAEVKPAVTKSKPSSRAKATPKTTDAAPKSKKRPSPAPEVKPRKKRKTAVSDDEDEEGDEVTGEPAAAKKDLKEEDPGEEKDDEHVDEAEEDEVNKTPLAKVEDSESELSEPIDDEPARRKKRQKKAASEKPAKPTKSSKATKSKPMKKQNADIDPQEAEIKRLQGWLVKCGIRKLWHRELASYETSKAKINHLKGMLTDAGMTGRFSVEKAAQIKEQRELAADLEAVQEQEKRWGMKEGSDENDEQGGEGKPNRRLARGLKELQAFADSDSE